MMSIGEAARRLGRCRGTVRHYADRGVLRIVCRDGATGARCVERADVERLRRAWMRLARLSRACWSCGGDIPQHRRYCAKDGCRKRRQRQRWRAWRAWSTCSAFVSRQGGLVIAALLVAGGALGAQTPRQEIPGNVLLVERDDPNDLRAVRVPDRDPVQPNGFYGPGVIVWTIGASDYNVYSRSVRAYFAGLQFATFGDGVRGYWVLASASGVPNPRYGPDGLIPRVVGFPDGHVNFNAGDDIVPAPPHTMKALRLDGVDVGPALAELQARLEALERRVR